MSETEKKLESFKIGDKQRPTATRSAVKPKQPQEVKPETTTLGFARIEGILEKEDPNKLKENLYNIINELEQFEQNASTVKDKTAVKKAKAAVERTLDLMEYLFQTKEAMVQAAQKAVHK